MFARHFFIIALLFHSLIAFSQDLIVTDKNDSINCKITKVKNDYIYFTFMHRDEVRNTLMHLNQTKHYQYNYFQQAEIPSAALTKAKSDHPSWYFSFNGGWSYRLAPLPDYSSSAEKNHYKKLKSGFHMEGNIQYFFGDFFGMGIKYDIHQSTAKSYTNKDQVSISFIGPSFSSRIYNQSKTNCWFFSIALGYSGFTHKVDRGYDSGKVKGNTVGFSYDIGYDIGLSKNWSLGFRFSVINGLISKVKMTDDNGITTTVELEKGNYEGLGRMNISAGLRYNL